MRATARTCACLARERLIYQGCSDGGCVEESVSRHLLQLKQTLKTIGGTAVHCRLLPHLIILVTAHGVVLCLGFPHSPFHTFRISHTPLVHVQADHPQISAPGLLHTLVQCLVLNEGAGPQVEPLRPAEGSQPGERVFFGEDGSEQPAPESPNKVRMPTTSVHFAQALAL